MTMGVTTVTDVRPAASPEFSAPFEPGTPPPAAPGGALQTLFRTEQGGHEQVVLCQDRASGLKAVIAVHNTALGPPSAAPVSTPTPPKRRPCWTR